MNYKLALISLIFCFANQAFGQQTKNKALTPSHNAVTQSEKHRCGTTPADEATHRYLLENIIANEQEIALLRNDVTDCLPVKVHIVRDDAGGGGLSLGDLAIAFANLNYVYYDANIEFFVCGDINYIDNSDFYDFNGTAPDSDSEAAFVAGEEVADAINVFFMNSLITNTGFNAAGYAYFPFNSAQSNRIFMINSVANNAPNSTFSHELGHYFSLYHTHRGTEFGNTHLLAERVARVAPDANCATDGDLLCDTDADPRYSSGDFDFNNCAYTGTEMDDLGVTYAPTISINNIMSYYPDACGGIFTAGQFTRIAAGLADRQGHTAYNYNCSAAVVAAPTGMTATLNGGSIDLAWTDNAANELGYIIERSTTSATAGFLPIVYGGVAPDVTAFTDPGNVASNTTYWYRVRPVNSACDNYSNVATITTAVIYCKPSYSSGCSQVALRDFSFTGDAGTSITNNTSGCSAGAYGDFTNLNADVTAGSSYNFEGSTLAGTCFGTFFPAFITVWVDWNQDGDFDEADERMLMGNDKLNPCFSGSFTVPATALTGSARMRVVIDFNVAPGDPCGNYSFGETEDYTLNVSGVGLPVVLSSFEGQLQEEAILLSWRTETEVNNDFFSLERSFDGETFREIAKISANKLAAAPNDYSYLDVSPFDGKNYYRLKQIDFDEKFSYSNIIVLDVRKEQTVAQIVPNPVQNKELGLWYQTLDAGKLQIEIIDVTGKIVASYNLTTEKGPNQFTINTAQLNAGVYFLRVQQNEKMQMLRFVNL